MVHGGANGDHLGRRRTKCQVQRRAYWPGWSDTIVSVLRKCALCACRHGHVNEAASRRKGKYDSRVRASQFVPGRDRGDTEVSGGSMTSSYRWAPPPSRWGRPEASASVAPPPPWGWSPMAWGPPPMMWDVQPSGSAQPTGSQPLMPWYPPPAWASQAMPSVQPTGGQPSSSTADPREGQPEDDRQ